MRELEVIKDEQNVELAANIVLMNAHGQCRKKGEFSSFSPYPKRMIIHPYNEEIICGLIIQPVSNGEGIGWI